MHVVFVSRCQLRALKKTRAVLDAYAVRTGSGSWATPITREALDEVRAALRRTATRQTAVACFANDGRTRMRLAWVVGSRKEFTASGAVPVGTTAGRRREPPAPWLRLVALLARAAGLAHDIGKASRMFQRKLRDADAPLKDAVRHEWLSMKVLQRLRAGAGWDDAWAFAGLHATALREMPQFCKRGHGMTGFADAIDLAVLTHHGLLHPDKPNALGGTPTVDGHVREEAGFDDRLLGPSAALPAKLLDTERAIESRLHKLQQASLFAATAWWPASLLARASLIAADHLVSSQDTQQPDEALYANTRRGIRGQLNQPLSWHLEQVGSAAQDLAGSMWTSFASALHEESVAAIDAGAEGRFAWQNKAAAHLERFGASHRGPVLVFNVAATGSGKTRMNARAACVLAKAQNKTVRLSIALNLRSLTLQTGAAIREQLKIAPDELAVVIGDRTTQRLFDAAAAPHDLDDNPPEPSFDVRGGDFEVPQWMNGWLEQHPRQQQLLGAPLLVSTIDYLVAAGEPHRQQHHVSALLRLASADLVLDEVDAYDGSALIAVLRLVQAAGLLGRNVIASSATLSEPVALGVARAFDSGVRQRAALHQSELATGVCLLSDATSAVSGCFDTAFGAWYAAYLSQAAAPVPQPPRLARLHPMPDIAAPAPNDQERAETAWFAHVLQAAERLHADNAWRYRDGVGRLSVGLVRVANIGPARRLARHLAAWAAAGHPGVAMRVACYHAQEFLIQRFRKEAELDRLLTRKGGRSGNGALEADTNIGAWMDAAQAQGKSLMLVVVATPVEEIGRDHDFDWAVVEPSSMQSLVQTAGRVNRHRLVPAEGPNIAVLQHNRQAWLGARLAFRWPGLETASCPYPSHDMAALLRWQAADGESRLPISAALRFDASQPFAALDDRSQREHLDAPVQTLASAGVGLPDPVLLTRAWYEKYPLREPALREQWRLSDDGRFEQQRNGVSGALEWFDENARVHRRPAHDCAWLAWPLEQLRQVCDAAGVEQHDGLSVQLRPPPEERPLHWDASFGFGVD